MIIYVIVIVIEQIKFHFDNASKASNCRNILIFFDKVNEKIKADYYRAFILFYS